MWDASIITSNILDLFTVRWIDEWMFMSFVHLLHSHVGLNEIQELTKQSLRNKPFCLAVGKEWEEKQRKMDLRDIHTKLSWTRKHRKASGFEQRELNDITQILSQEQLGEDGPVRILVEGKNYKTESGQESKEGIFSCHHAHKTPTNTIYGFFSKSNSVKSIKYKM